MLRGARKTKGGQRGAAVDPNKAAKGSPRRGDQNKGRTKGNGEGAAAADDALVDKRTRELYLELERERARQSEVNQEAGRLKMIVQSVAEQNQVSVSRRSQSFEKKAEPRESPEEERTCRLPIEEYREWVRVLSHIEDMTKTQGVSHRDLRAPVSNRARRRPQALGPADDDGSDARVRDACLGEAQDEAYLRRLRRGKKTNLAHDFSCESEADRARSGCVVANLMACVIADDPATQGAVISCHLHSPSTCTIL